MKPMTERQEEFREQVETFGNYPPQLRKEFFDYWTEPNMSGKKMRFELEKTWDLSRRLARWANTTKTIYKHSEAAKMALTKPQQEKPLTEIEALDEALKAYLLHPSTIPVKSLAKWYDLLKKENLMRKFTAEEVEDIKTKHGKDLEMCRGLCVMMTFDAYALHTITFSDLIKSRGKNGI